MTYIPISKRGDSASSRYVSVAQRRNYGQWGYDGQMHSGIIPSGFLDKPKQTLSERIEASRPQVSKREPEAKPKETLIGKMLGAQPQSAYTPKRDVDAALKISDIMLRSSGVKESTKKQIAEEQKKYPYSPSSSVALLFTQGIVNVFTGVKTKREMEGVKKEYLKDYKKESPDRYWELNNTGQFSANPGLPKKSIEKAWDRVGASEIEKWAFRGIEIRPAITGMQFVNSKQASAMIASASKSKLTLQDLKDITTGKVTSGVKFDAYRAITADPSAKKELLAIAKNTKIPLKTKIADYLKGLLKTTEAVKVSGKAITGKELVTTKAITPISKVASLVIPKIAPVAQKGVVEAFKPETGVIPQLKPVVTVEAKPVAKEIIPSQFFDRKFKEPGIAKYITPGNRYARSLGVYDLVEPSIKANTALQLERAKQFKNLDKIERAIYKIEKVKIPEKIAKAVIRKTPQRIRGWYNMLDKYDTAKEAGLTGEKAEIFTELRSLTKGMLERTNEVRTEVGLEPIRNIKGYITHIFDMATKKALSKMYSMPEVTKYWTDFTRSKHIYNPTAFHRLASDPRGLLRDPIAALRTMVSVDLKQIYMEQPNQLYREQMNKLEDVIPASTRKWVDSYMDVAIKGRPTEFDKLTNASLEKLGVRKALDLILKPFGRTSSSNLAVSMANGLSRLIHDAVIWGKVRLVLRNHTQKFLNLGMYGTKAFVKASFPAPKALKETIKDSDFWKISNRSFVETQVGLGKGVIKKLENLGYKPYGHSHISNVNHAMKTAYYAGKELVDNPKYAKLGWTMDDVAREMEHGAMSTQYWYNKMGMPEIFRSGAGKILMTLQSWWMNYTANYWREMLVRGFTGKTGWGKSIPVKWRLASIRHIITSLIFIEGMRKAFDLEYRQIALLGVLPTYLSPPGQMVLGLYNYLFAGDDDWKRKKAINQMKYSWKSFLPGSGAWKEWSGLWSGKKTLKETLFYTGKKEEPKTSSSVSNGTSRYGEAKSIGKSRY